MRKNEEKKIEYSIFEALDRNLYVFSRAAAAFLLISTSACASLAACVMYTLTYTTTKEKKKWRKKKMNAKYRSSCHLGHHSFIFS